MIAMIPNTPVTMTSKEMADLTEKRHDNVKRVIDSLAEKGVIASPQIEETSFAGADGRKQTMTAYRIGKRDSYVIVAQLSPEFTARLVDRWQELEEQSEKPALNPANFSRMQLIELAMQAEQERMETEKKCLALETTVNTLAPKAVALDMISAGTDTLTMTEVAKVLGLKRNDLTARLHAEGWIYRQNGSWVAYDSHIRNGCLQYKEATYTDDKTGQECRKPYCHVTPKGLTKLARMFSVELETA